MYAVTEGNAGYNLSPRSLRELLLKDHTHKIDPSNVPKDTPNRVLYSLMRSGVVQWVD